MLLEWKTAIESLKINVFENWSLHNALITISTSTKRLAQYLPGAGKITAGETEAEKEKIDFLMCLSIA